MPGHADDFLFDQGLIGEGTTLEAARTAGHLSPHIPTAYTRRAPAAFSRAINAALAGAGRGDWPGALELPLGRRLLWL